MAASEDKELRALLMDATGAALLPAPPREPNSLGLALGRVRTNRLSTCLRSDYHPADQAHGASAVKR